MSKNIRVIVLCPHGRRETVNLTPNSSILQILEEACRKQQINPDDFDLCHYNKPLDLSLPVRFASLPNNAQLELQPTKNARKDSLVTVGLQLESGERIMKDFVPTTSVWEVMEQCLKKRSDQLNIDEKGEPVCIYMRQKLVGDAIKNTTLRSLGLIKGSAIIRLIYRNPEDLCDQAHVSSPLTKPPPKEEEMMISDNKSKTINEMAYESQVENILKDSVTNIITQENTNVSNIVSENQNLIHYSGSRKSENFQSLKVEEEEQMAMEEMSSMEIVSNIYDTNAQNKNKMSSYQDMETNDDAVEESTCGKDIGAIHYIGGRHAVLYSLDDITEVKKADFPDEFFELTMDDIKYLMQEYKKARFQLENQPLLTKELRKQKLLEKLGAYKQSVIRIYFPERLVLQAVFQVEETVQDICEFVRDYLEDKSLNFYLYTTPPKEKTDPTKSLIELMLIPAAVMYFGCDSYLENYLMKSLREKISDPRAASLAAYESRKKSEPVELVEDNTELIEMPKTSVENAAEEYKAPGPSFSETTTSIKRSENVPKWLKLSKK